MISLAFIMLLPFVASHSWMTCPPSFNTQMGRGGIQGAQCEGWEGPAVTVVEAGDRLKVGWTSNNHGGGIARIALVKYGDHKGDSARQNFNEGVMKYACYGHDTRAGKYRYGDCVHPCNGRPGCQYHSDPKDKKERERFDTTIGIPTNLNGDYVLQTAMVVGNGGVYYSCAKLRIFGGNTGFSCRSNNKPVEYTCEKAGAGLAAYKKLMDNSKRGDFCYGLDGSIGTVDDYMYDVPINVECDPRQTCGNAAQRGVCQREFPDMARILNPSTHPIMPNCRVFNVKPVFK